jgi:hypothetical protein
VTTDQAAPAATPEHPSHGGFPRWVYWVIGGVLIVLVVVGLVTYNSAKNDQEAKQKAQQLTQAFRQAGLPVPADTDHVARWLGTDGGAACNDPGAALGKATLYDLMTNGADFVGRRPVLVDRQILQGELLILQTYCPDKLAKYEDTIKKLKFADTIKN